MQALKYWAKYLTLDAVIIALFILWKQDGIDGAGNTLLALIWLASILKLTCGLVLNKSSFENYPKRPPGFSTYNHISKTILFCALAFYGMFILSAIQITAHLLIEAARNREPDVKKRSAA